MSRSIVPTEGTVRLLSSLFILLALSGITFANLAACGPIGIPGLYILDNSISTGVGNCIDINTGFVTIDCGGLEINSTAGRGISVNSVNNVEIRDCVINGSTDAITLVSSSGHVMTNNILTGNVGIRFDQYVYDSVISNNTIYSTVEAVYFGLGSSRNSIANNSILNNGRSVGFNTDCDNNNVTGNNMSNGGIKIDSSYNNTFVNNRFNITGVWGTLEVPVSGYTGNTFTNMTFFNQYGKVTYPGFDIPSSYSGNVLTSSHFNIQWDFGISLPKIFVNSSNVSFLNTTAHLRLNGLTFASAFPTIDVNDGSAFINCSGSICQNSSYNSTAGTLDFDVTGFTAYSANGTAAVTACGTNLNSPGTYMVTQDLTLNSGNCVQIQANDVTLDCAGHEINYSQTGGGNGIYIFNYNNSVVKNCILRCNISNWGIGTTIEGSHNTVSNNTAFGCLGFKTQGSGTNNTIINNTIDSTDGALSIQANGTRVINNTITTNGSNSGIVASAYFGVFDGNSLTFSSDWTSGLDISGSRNNFTNNIVTGTHPSNLQVGIDVNGPRNYLVNNTVNVNNNSYGLLVERTENNSLENNSITLNGDSSVGIALLGNDTLPARYNAFYNDVVSIFSTNGIGLMFDTFTYDGSVTGNASDNNVTRLSVIVPTNMARYITTNGESVNNKITQFQPAGSISSVQIIPEITLPVGLVFTNSQLNMSWNATRGSDQVYLNTSNATIESLFNVSAYLTVGNEFDESRPLFDELDSGAFINCTAPRCTSVTSSTNLVGFGVTSFSSYSSESASTRISSCRDLTVENGRYTLNQTVENISTCFNVLANNVTLNCKGYTINYSQTNFGYGINVTGYNLTTIKNCNVVQGGFSSSSPGIYLESSSGNNITGTNISATGSDAFTVYLVSSNNNTITSNRIANTASDGVRLFSSSNNTFTSNNITSSSSDAVYLASGSENNAFVFNSISSTTRDGVRLGSSSNNNFTSNTITSTDDIGAILGSSLNNIFSSNNISAGLSYIDMDALSAGNNFTNTTFFTSYGRIRYPARIGFPDYTGISVTGQLLNISSNSTFLNSSSLPYLNVSVFIQLNGLPFTQAKVMYDLTDGGAFTDCPLSRCTWISYSGGTLSFNVSSFTSYAAAENVTGAVCNDALNIAGTTYLMVADSSSAGGCFNITADNVTLDCQSHTIIYGTGGTACNGIQVQYFDNATIKNCIIDAGTNGVNNIWINGSAGHMIQNNILLNNNTGGGVFALQLQVVNSTTIIGNTMVSSRASGFYSNAGLGIMISDNNITSATTAINFVGGTNSSTASDNALILEVGGASYAVSLTRSHNNTISNNQITSFYGFNLNNSNDNNVTNNGPPEQVISSLNLRKVNVLLLSGASTLATELPSPTIARLNTSDTSGLTFIPVLIGGYGSFTPLPTGSPAGTQLVNIPDGSGKSGYFKMTFTLPAGFTGAQLNGAANVDDQGRIFLNGVPLTAGLGGGAPDEITQFGDVHFSTSNSAIFRAGANEIILSDFNSGGGPSSAAFYVNVTYWTSDTSTVTKWVTKSPMPTPRYSMAVQRIADKIYVAGGDNSCTPACGANVLKTLEAYDIRTDTWETKANMSVARRRPAGAMVGGLFYVIGGDLAGTNERYDYSTDSWTTMAAMSTPRSLARAVAIGNLIYMIGGTDNGNNARNLTEVYNTSDDTWYSAADMPAPRSGPAVGVYRGKIYVVGGGTDCCTTGTSTTFVYTPATNTWASYNSSSTGMDSTGVQMAGGFIGDYLFMIGTRGESGIASIEDGSEFSVLDTGQPSGGPPVLDWFNQDSLPIYRGEAGFTVTNGAAYVFGGLKNLQNGSYAYLPSTTVYYTQQFVNSVNSSSNRFTSNSFDSMYINGGSAFIVNNSFNGGYPRINVTGGAALTLNESYYGNYWGPQGSPYSKPHDVSNASVFPNAVFNDSYPYKLFRGWLRESRAMLPAGASASMLSQDERLNVSFPPIFSTPTLVSIIRHNVMEVLTERGLEEGSVYEVIPFYISNGVSSSPSLISLNKGLTSTVNITASYYDSQIMTSEDSLGMFAYDDGLSQNGMPRWRMLNAFQNRSANTFTARMVGFGGFGRSGENDESTLGAFGNYSIMELIKSPGFDTTAPSVSASFSNGVLSSTVSESVGSASQNEFSNSISSFLLHNSQNQSGNINFHLAIPRNAVISSATMALTAVDGPVNGGLKMSFYNKYPLEHSRVLPRYALGIPDDPVAVPYGDSVYFIGGMAFDSVTVNVMVYNTTANTFTWKNSDSPTSRYLAAYGVNGSEVFITDGSTQIPLPGYPTCINTTYVYNIATDSWSNVSQNPFARVLSYGLFVQNARNATGDVLGDTFFVFGGFNANNADDLVDGNYTYIFDRSSNAWFNGAWTGSEDLFGARLAQVNGYMYRFGGSDTFEASVSTVKLYNIYAPYGVDTWTSKTSMPTARANMAIGTINNIIYVAGGGNGRCTIKSSVVEAYNPATDSWSTKASMPKALCAAAHAVVNGKLYVFDSGGTSDVFVYDPSSDSWSIVTPQFQFGESTTQIAAINLDNFAGSSTYNITDNLRYGASLCRQLDSISPYCVVGMNIIGYGGYLNVSNLSIEYSAASGIKIPYDPLEGTLVRAGYIEFASAGNETTGINLPYGIEPLSATLTVEGHPYITDNYYPHILSSIAAGGGKVVGALTYVNGTGGEDNPNSEIKAAFLSQDGGTADLVSVAGRGYTESKFATTIAYDNSNFIIGWKDRLLHAMGNTSTVCMELMAPNQSITGALRSFISASDLPKIAASGTGFLLTVDTENTSDTNIRVQAIYPYLNGNYISGFGSQGSGDGQFNAAYGIVIDSSGNIYIADENNNRVEKFSNSGTFITSWGSLGSGDGQFNAPRGLAIDALDNIYVTDQGNQRVQKFDTSGTFLLKWGTNGTGVGQFIDPAGIAVDSVGNVYISEICSQVPGQGCGCSISKFTNAGAPLLKFGSCGTGNGQISMPNALAVDSSGNIFVSDRDNERIQAFDSTGAYVAQWGSFGRGDGMFWHPEGIVINESENRIYVADGGSSRIQVFNMTGGYVTQWNAVGQTTNTCGLGSTSSLFPGGMAQYGSDQIFVVNGYVSNVVQKYNRTGDQRFGPMYEINSTAPADIHNKQEVASNGSGYFVVWNDFRDNVSESHVYGRPVAENGTPLGYDTVISKRIGYSQSGVVIAYSPASGKYLVVWREGNSSSPISEPDVIGRFINASTGVPIGSDFVIDNSSYSSDSAIFVASDGTDFIVAFGDQIAAGNWNVYGRKVLADGTFGSRFTIVDSSGNQIFPSVAWNGSAYVSTWIESPFTADAEVKQNVFDSNGIEIYPESTVATKMSDGPYPSNSVIMFGDTVLGTVSGTFSGLRTYDVTTAISGNLSACSRTAFLTCHMPSVAVNTSTKGNVTVSLSVPYKARYVFTSPQLVNTFDDGNTVKELNVTPSGVLVYAYVPKLAKTDQVTVAVTNSSAISLSIDILNDGEEDLSTVTGGTIYFDESSYLYTCATAASDINGPLCLVPTKISSASPTTVNISYELYVFTPPWALVGSQVNIERSGSTLYDYMNVPTSANLGESVVSLTHGSINQLQDGDVVSVYGVDTAGNFRRQAVTITISGGGSGTPGSGGCSPSWSCTIFSACDQSGYKRRTCSDAAGCGTNSGKPAEFEKCKAAVSKLSSGCVNQEIRVRTDPVSASVAVTLSGAPFTSGTSDSSGIYAFTPNAAGQYAVTASKGSYDPGSVTVIVPACEAGGISAIRRSLQCEGIICKMILDINSAMLTNVLLDLSGYVPLKLITSTIQLKEIVNQLEIPIRDFVLSGTQVRIVKLASENLRAVVDTSLTRVTVPFNPETNVFKVVFSNPADPLTVDQVVIDLPADMVGRNIKEITYTYPDGTSRVITQFHIEGNKLIIDEPLEIR